MFGPIRPGRTGQLWPPGHKTLFRQPQAALPVESLVELHVESPAASSEALSEALSAEFLSTRGSRFRHRRPILH